MVAKLRRDNGANILDSVLTRISLNPLRPYSLSNSLKKFAGTTTRQLHNSTINELKLKWEQQLKDANPAEYPALNKRKDTAPINYVMPASISRDEIIALKHGRGIAPVFIKIDKHGHEQNILKIGYQEEEYFRYAAGKLVWDESRVDLRYHKRSFNVINIYSLQTKTYKQLTHHTRMFAPSLSEDGKYIIAVDVSYENQISLVILDAGNGSELKRFKSPLNYMLQNPRFNDDGSKIVVVAVGQQGKTLYELNVETEKFLQLLPFQKQLISKPEYAADQIVFKAHYNGIDNLYSLNPGLTKILQITSVKFGAYNPSFDKNGNRIIFNNYQPSGLDIAFLKLDSMKPIVSSSKAVDYIAPIVAQEGNHDVFDSIPSNAYPTRPFKEINNLFYFHSLLPVAEKNEFFSDYNFGLKLQSDNKLNTLSFYSGYRFNNSLKKSEYFTGLTYSKFFPVITLSYLNQARLIYRRVTGSPSTVIPVNWREHEAELDVSLPFSFNRLNYSYFTGVQTSTSYTSRYEITNRPNTFISTLSFPIKYRFYFGRNTNRSPRDLAPRWGQNFSVVYRNFPFENQLSGNLLVLSSNLFFPGILTNHSFQASFNYQKTSGSYASTIDIPKVSGYSNLTPKGGLQNTLLTKYRFPIFYPDWEIGPLAYIKRFTGGLFADFENVGKGNPFTPRTYGAEVKADMNLLRFYLPNFIPSLKIIFVNEKPSHNPILEAGLTYNY